MSGEVGVARGEVGVPILMGRDELAATLRQGRLPGRFGIITVHQLYRGCLLRRIVCREQKRVVRYVLLVSLVLVVVLFAVAYELFS